MEYLIFTMDLCFKSVRWLEKESLSELDMLLNSNYKISDDYDSHWEYGFYRHDDENALIHAVRMLKLLRTEKKCDEKEREIWKKQLLKDLRNYLYCVSCGLRFKFKMLRLVFQETAAEELEEPLAEIIEEYYRDNFEGKGDYDGKAALDYERLYIDIGDRILFLRQDWKLAMRYYGLADLDWFHLRDTSCIQRTVSISK